MRFLRFLSSLFNARNQSTRESEPTGFLGVGGSEGVPNFHEIETSLRRQQDHA